MTSLGNLKLGLGLNISSFQSATKQLSASTRQMNETMARLETRFHKVSKQSNLLGLHIKRVGGYLGGFATIGGAISAVQTMADFGDTMANVKAITKSTGDVFKKLEKQAIDLGRSTRFSSTEAAQGQEFLARAGFKTDEIFKALPGTLLLAQSAKVGIGEAADIASNALSAFGLAADETGRMVDIMANTISSSNTDLIQLQDGLKLVAPVAKMLGVNMETTAAAIGVLSDAGLQATLAGTGLRKVMFDLTDDKSAKVLQNYGLTMQDVSVETHGLVHVLEILRKANISNADAIQLFGARGTPAYANLLSNIPKLKELAQTNLLAAGTAQRMADIQDNTLAGALKRVSSALDGFVQTVGYTEGAASHLQAMVDGLANSINWATDNLGFMAKAVSTVILAWKFDTLVAGIALVTKKVKGLTVVTSALRNVTRGLMRVIGIGFAFEALDLVITHFEKARAAGLSWLETFSEGLKRIVNWLARIPGIIAESLRAISRVVAGGFMSLFDDNAWADALEEIEKGFQKALNYEVFATIDLDKRIKLSTTTNNALPANNLSTPYMGYQVPASIKELHQEIGIDLSETPNKVGQAWDSVGQGLIRDFKDFGNIGETVMHRLSAQLLDALIVEPVNVAVGGFIQGAMGGVSPKAIGGDVGAAKTYLVGEEGAELFVPKVSGTIVPQGQVNDALARLDGAGVPDMNARLVAMAEAPVKKMQGAMENATFRKAMENLAKGGGQPAQITINYNGGAIPDEATQRKHARWARERLLGK